MVATAINSVTMVLWKETAFPLCRAMERRRKRNVVSWVSFVIVVIRIIIIIIFIMFYYAIIAAKHNNMRFTIEIYTVSQKIHPFLFLL